MELNSEQKRFTFWLGITFLIWWAGIGPSDLYALPMLIVFVEVSIWVIKDRFFTNLKSLSQQLTLLISRPSYSRILIIFLGLQGLLWFLVVILRFYSFQLWTWDAGIHSNILYNISNGEFYSSYLSVNNLGDHFTPSFNLLAVLYKITPSIHWMMGAKVIAFVITPVIFYFILLFELKDKKQAQFWAFILGFGWLILYSPNVNAVRYEFQASSLSPPFIAASFLMLRQKRWFWFSVFSLLLLGFKEHMGAVFIGFGVSGLLKKESPILSASLVLIGIGSIYLIMFQAMPYFRNYQASWSGLERIDPFIEIPQKFYYLLKLLLPLGFVPLIFWRNGIMAGPAVGINLISRTSEMYTAHYHYDDVSSALLFLALIISIKEWKGKGFPLAFPQTKVTQIVLLFSFILFVSFLPRSAPRYLKDAWPSQRDFQLDAELKSLNKKYPSAYFVVQDVLGPHLHRRNISVLAQYKDHDGITQASCAEDLFWHGSPIIADFIVISEHVSDYQIDDYASCLQQLNESPIFTPVEGYQHLNLFKKVYK
ncbi:MAG: DUF2079 domain-containing protein [SAR324 cluster bacterium]|nr:DUF2079 domain-containing protein [SAR324 cluster bacterium]